MGPVENLSPYGFGFLPNVDRYGDEILVVAVAARFALPRPGRIHHGELEASEDQPPPPLADVHWGDPATTSIRYEGLNAYTRPATDVYLNGSAWARRGRPVEQMDVEVRVGPCQARARVIGDRVWVSAFGTLRASPPVAFEHMPLRWERAFGGGSVDAGERGFEARNPLGVGLYRSIEQAADAPLPNVEDPRALVTEPWSRPAPVGFGAVARHWRPRIGFAGTYDEPWTRTRAPLWPDDFDERFFIAAAPGLWASPHLRGGESVVLGGLHPEGGFGFRLPTVRLSCKSVFFGRVDRHVMRLDAVWIEPDEMSLTLGFRCVVRFGRGGDHRYTVIRELEPWEPAPELAPVSVEARG
ncbi:MAG TPA: DUF2169 domain-containing protein [Enhygromyxa sp.]|nr:DUF2169 domain-containing protein [Enhygromyxa sp.]